MAEKRTGADILYFPESCIQTLTEILEKQIVIIEAPVGYGKSVTVRGFLDDQSVDVFWIPLLEIGADRLWSELNRQFYDRYPQIRSIISGSTPLSQLPFLERIQQLSVQIRLLPLDRPVVIVIDDYQLANTPENSDLIEAIARQKLLNVHLVFIMRDDFCGNRNLMQLKGDVSLISFQTFQFTKEDIKYAYSLHRVQLSDQEISHLFDLCEGWIAPLRLFLADYNRIGIFSTPVSIYDFIGKQIFTPLKKEMQDFLRAMSPFEQFSLEQAEFVWHEHNEYHIADILRYLRCHNAFLYYEECSQTFRLHNLLREYLGWELLHHPQAERAQIYETCARWFVLQKDYWPALGLFRMARDYQQLLDTIARDSMSSMSFVRWPLLCELLADCPRTLFIEYPDVLFLMRLMAFFHGDRTSAGNYLQLTLELENSLEPDDPLRPLLRERDELILGVECYNDLDAMTSHFHKVSHIRKIPFLQDEIVWTMGCPSVLMMFHRRAGKLQEEIRQFRKENTIYSRIADGHGSGAGALLEAEACLNCGNLEAAQALAHEAEASAARYRQLSNICMARFILLRCAVMLDDPELAQSHYKELMKLAQEDTSLHYMVRNMITIGMGFLDSVAERFFDVPEWLQSGSDIRSNVYRFSWPVCQIIYGRCLIGSEDYLKLTGVFRCLMKEPEYSRHIMFLIYAGIYIAVASDCLGYRWEAESILTQTLELATPDQIYLPFAETYHLVPGLYDAVSQYNGCQNAVDAIKNMSHQIQRGLTLFYGPKRTATQRPLLTEREKEIARLAWKGMTNQEIGDELFIAVTTVKRALVDIYKKLNIHGRAELNDCHEHFT